MKAKSPAVSSSNKGLRGIVIGFLAGSFALSSASHAQTWGSGMWGGMQGCPYNNGPAGGANSDDDTINELNQREKELKQDQKDIKAESREKEKEKRELLRDLQKGLNDNWSNVFMAHMDHGQNCGVCGDQPAQPAPGGDGDEGNGDQADNAGTRREPVPSAPTKKNPKKKKGDVDDSDNVGPAPSDDQGSNEVGFKSRLPAAAEQVGGTNNPPDEWGVLGQGQSGGGAGAGAGNGTLCYPNEAPYNRREWKYACRAGGNINPAVCSIGPFRRDGASHGDSYACAHALEKYRKLIEEMDQLDIRKKQNDDDIAQLKIDRRDAERDRREAQLEANCATCHPGQHGTAGGTPNGSGRSWTDSLVSTGLPILGGLVAGGAAEGLSYMANNQNNALRMRMGYGALPYSFGSAGLPYVGMGLQYGALAGGVNGSFGCSPGLGGSGSPYGPLGMGGPLGLSPFANMGGAFGYPPGMMPGFPSLGGGMFNQGFGPWGAAGPWSYGGNTGSPFLNGARGSTNGFGGLGGSPFTANRSPVAGLGGAGGSPFGFAGMPGGFGGPTSLGGSPFLGGSAYSGLPTASPFGLGSQPYNSINPFGSSYSSPFGGGVTGSPFTGTTNSPLLAQQAYYNNYMGRQMQGASLARGAYSLQSELSQFNNGLSLLNGYSSPFGLGNYGYGSNSIGTYSPLYYNGGTTTQSPFTSYSH